MSYYGKEESYCWGDAYDHIAGLTIMNEGTLRDWVRQNAKFKRDAR